MESSLQPGVLRPAAATDGVFRDRSVPRRVDHSLVTLKATPLGLLSRRSRANLLSYAKISAKRVDRSDNDCNLDKRGKTVGRLSFCSCTLPVFSLLSKPAFLFLPKHQSPLALANKEAGNTVKNCESALWCLWLIEY